MFVAVAGHPYGPNPERGIYRSTDGAKTFEKVLYKNENIGAAGVTIDPTDPNVVYATLWEAREGPWENAGWNGTGGGIFKSTDGGQTWNQLAGGLPDGIVEAYVSVGASDPKRLFASVATKESRPLRFLRRRSDLAQRPPPIPRPKGRIGGGDLPVPMLDPKNPDVGLHDFHRHLEVHRRREDLDRFPRRARRRRLPEHLDQSQRPARSFSSPATRARLSPSMAASRGARGTTSRRRRCITCAADNAFPYRLCGGQQESGSACIFSRGNDGEITFRDWHPVAARRVRLCRARPARS